jgi:hypothetical protein
VVAGAGFGGERSDAAGGGRVGPGDGVPPVGADYAGARPPTTTGSARTLGCSRPSSAGRPCA